MVKKKMVFLSPEEQVDAIIGDVVTRARQRQYEDDLAKQARQRKIAYLESRGLTVGKRSFDGYTYDCAYKLSYHHPFGLSFLPKIYDYDLYSKNYWGFDGMFESAIAELIRRKEL